MIAKDLGGRFGEFIQVDAQVALVLAEAFRRRVRQVRQAVEVEVSIVLAETLRCRVRQVRQTVERERYPSCLLRLSAVSATSSATTGSCMRSHRAQETLWQQRESICSPVTGLIFATYSSLTRPRAALNPKNPKKTHFLRTAQRQAQQLIQKTAPLIPICG